MLVQLEQTADLSVIIATRNSRAFVGDCLRSIADAPDVRVEVVLVDNASSDGTPEIVRARFPTAVVIDNASNVGHCRAINQGLRCARADLVLVLDVDTVVEPGALSQVVAFLRSQGPVAIVAPRMVNPDGSVQETARRFPTMINGIFGRQSILTRWLPNNRFSARYLHRQSREEREPFHVDWVSAACMAFRRGLVTQIGEWDEGFVGYWVDADWCVRAHAVGRVVCLPSARVVHLEQNRRGRRKAPRRIWQFHSGASRFYRKHYTRGWFDPRALAASAILTLRAGLLIAGNAALERDPAEDASVDGARLQAHATRVRGESS